MTNRAALKGDIRSGSERDAEKRDVEKEIVAEKGKEQGKQMWPEKRPEWVEERVNGGKREEEEGNKEERKKGQRKELKKREERLNKAANGNGKEKDKIESLHCHRYSIFLRVRFRHIAVEHVCQPNLLRMIYPHWDPAKSFIHSSMTNP